MASGPLKAVAALLASSVGLYPVTSHAYALDAQFDCQAHPHEFIGQLIDDKYIEANPMRIDTNSVNAFRPVRGSDITAFGFRVYAVLGYEPDDEMFKKGRGQALAGPLYGAVLSAPSESVEKRVRAAGSTATVHMVIPLLLTAVVCTR
ncbi:hypothetical protein BCh11DRAFT_02748 [Burkholderia sp. Ch1-1]|uniref:Uncharacterized protein n=1 Tax=Paraburkholderia dioscoreae TaxID=2604047 RepID=A0A5Q4ZEN0_9BURK|nr:MULTISPECIES: hypothetical protein [Paraburkholderia]EIF34939.1 hypothetical protein BCh11DRAFT_02748 [Burkholderia sp. Ch1-1]MDR8396501.1 hypothetical protein [Paraburkholderia sp. USG1]VVD34121.1 conserved exported protein of unknown function [Paraburkholderia dioscoreae]